MSPVRIIVMGNMDAGDDGAALIACTRLSPGFKVLPAGRPGPALLDLLSPGDATVLVDVTRGAGAPGLVTVLPLEKLGPLLKEQLQVSSHGFGPAETLRLGQALGRGIPAGYFVGIEGECFGPGRGLSQSVEHNLDVFVEAIEEAAGKLSSDGGPDGRV